MQVEARVTRAPAAWAGLAETALVARGFAEGLPVQALSRRRGLTYARVELQFPGGRRLLVVTLDHPRN